ncbi:MAG: ATP-dependent metallopeptidase FtsH/Yme1/Tma family protein, partial [Pseudomonadota bacterium]
MNMRNLVIWGLIGMLFVAMVVAMQGNGTPRGAAEFSYSRVLTEAEAGNLSQVTISDTRIEGTLADGNAFYAEKGMFDPDLGTALTEDGVEVTYKTDDGGGALGALFLNLIP